MLRLNLVLPSGRSESLAVDKLAKVADLKILAQNVFSKSNLTLVTVEGRALTNPLRLLQDERLQDGDFLTILVQQVELAATRKAFASCGGGNGITTWGCGECGSDSHIHGLQNVQHIQCTHTACAALLADGSVTTWGPWHSGGDSSAVQDQLKNVQQIQATNSAFAAIRADRSVVTWGSENCGGDSSAGRRQAPERPTDSGLTLCFRSHPCRWIRCYLGWKVLWWWQQSSSRSASKRHAGAS